ncbi:MAG: hypothetical protein GXP29_01145, partial [Planctomycetes bacterium]|nr:hypothetical protein [Planctomycetota bacterium]
MMILRCIHQNGIKQDATHRRRWSVRVAVLLLPLLTLASLLACDESRADVALAKCSGTLGEEQGVRVLRLWGTPREQGHAHGLLLGPHIVGMMRQLLDGPVLFNDPREYELGIREKLLPRLRQTEAEREELAGMLEGIRERVGKNELMLKRMKRPIDALDLFAVNTLADWIPGACSSFAAWGEKTSDGGMVVGRNLDYFNLPGLRKLHLVIVRKNTDSEASGWVS